jgi:uncharacterized protein YecE (DUF72 family)
VTHASDIHPNLRLGTCSWSTADWVGSVYESGTKSVDYIAQYAQRFNAVEIDSTFYATPRRSTVEGWADRTPETFVFASKVPQVITHEKFMEGCQGDLANFLDTMSLLGPRLGPILFQFPYFAKRRGVTLDNFLERLTPFLDEIPKKDFQFAVEVRNKTWITDQLLDLLRHHAVPLALIDHPWMHRPAQLFRNDDIFTGPFLYVRWLGDRKGIEKVTTTWRDHVVDRESDMAQWIPPIKRALDRQMNVFGFVNNHYSGHAPGDVTRFQKSL